MEHEMQKYFDNIVQSTVDILKFDSSLKEADGDYPFGKETADCLHFFLNLAAEMGFETHNYDNYVGEVVFGEGKDFAILAHSLGFVENRATVVELYRYRDDEDNYCKKRQCTQSYEKVCNAFYHRYIKAFTVWFLHDNTPI